MHLLWENSLSEGWRWGGYDGQDFCLGGILSKHCLCTRNKRALGYRFEASRSLEQK
jgi:hypothetical protein